MQNKHFDANRSRVMTNVPQTLQRNSRSSRVASIWWAFCLFECGGKFTKGMESGRKSHFSSRLRGTMKLINKGELVKSVAGPDENPPTAHICCSIYGACFCRNAARNFTLLENAEASL